MTIHTRSFALVLALAVVLGAQASSLPPAAAQMGGGGYAGPPAGLSPGPTYGGFYGGGLYPGFNLPRPVFRPTIGLPPWPLSVPMGEGGVVFGQQLRPLLSSGGNMRSPYAGLALRDTGAGINWVPTYNYAPSSPGLPPSLAWPWWQYSPAAGWAPTPYYAQRYVGGRWVPIVP